MAGVFSSTSNKIAFTAFFKEREECFELLFILPFVYELILNDMKKTWILFLMLLLARGMNAAEQFVVFQTAADVLSLQDAGISFDNKEHSCVQRAVANLKLDFERVTGRMPSEGRAGILIGTVGVNKQIDQWVKKGELRDLKGKTEKFIIKTIGDQLVIAGSEHRF